jgi:hypothetical protein
MKQLAFSLVLCIAFTACRNRTGADTPAQAEEISETAAAVVPPDDFMIFYNKFHADSLFQVTHIAWPLRGETSELVDSVNRRKLVEWKPETWRMHHPLDLTDSDFKREWEVMGNELVIERIRYAAANYGLERRFTKRDDGAWELVYYSDMNEIGR